MQSIQIEDEYYENGTIPVRSLCKFYKRAV